MSLYVSGGSHFYVLSMPGNDRVRDIAVVEHGFEGYVADMYGKFCVTVLLQTYGAVVFEQI